MSSRSLGLAAGFFVSHARSSPPSCCLISPGSSVRNSTRPLSLTLSGRLLTSRGGKSATLRFYSYRFNAEEAERLQACHSERSGETAVHLKKRCHPERARESPPRRTT